MMIFSLVAMIELEKCCITSACLQWLCDSGERTVAHGPVVLVLAQLSQRLKVSDFDHSCPSLSSICPYIRQVHSEVSICMDVCLFGHCGVKNW